MKHVFGADGKYRGTLSLEHFQSIQFIFSLRQSVWSGVTYCDTWEECCQVGSLCYLFGCCDSRHGSVPVLQESAE